MLLSPAENDPIKIVDWIELQALTSADKTCSLEEVRTYIDADGTLKDDGKLPHESSERLIASSISEIRRRIRNTGPAYPFSFSGTILKASVSKKYMPYIFCLLIVDREYYNPGAQEPARMFEHLVCEAAKSYIGGNAVRFGWPRDSMATGICDAINELVTYTKNHKMSNGYPYNAIDKDLGLDVVAWKNFPDNYWGQIELLVQCATGQIWESKKNECNLAEWRGILYWSIDPTVCLAIPYVIAENDWVRSSAGVLLMDRIRIASVLGRRQLTCSHSDWWSWCKERINEVKKNNQ